MEQEPLKDKENICPVCKKLIWHKHRVHIKCERKLWNAEDETNEILLDENVMSGRNDYKDKRLRELGKWTKKLIRKQ